MKTSPYIFISYSTKNQQDAELVRQSFTDNELSCWMAPYDIPPGSSYGKQINIALENCACLVLLLSNASQDSLFVQKEVERAITYKKTIYPILLEDLELNDTFKFFIGDCQFINARNFSINNPNFLGLINMLKSTFKGSTEIKQEKDELVSKPKVTENNIVVNFKNILTKLYDYAIEYRKTLNSADVEEMKEKGATIKSKLDEMLIFAEKNKFNYSNLYEIACNIERKYNEYFLWQEKHFEFIYNDTKRHNFEEKFNKFVDLVLEESLPNSEHRKQFLKDVESLKEPFNKLPKELEKKKKPYILCTVISLLATFLVLCGSCSCISMDNAAIAVAIFIIIFDVLILLIGIGVSIPTFTDVKKQGIYNQNKCNEELRREINKIYQADYDKTKKSFPKAVKALNIISVILLICCLFIIFTVNI